MTKILIPYAPRRWARSLHEATTRWIALIIHRRGGKTTAAFNHLQRDALTHPNTRYAYIAPTFKQAKRIVWGMAKRYSATCPNVKYNISELSITYANGSEILILGAAQADSLRGMGLWGCFLDEFPQMSPVIFTEIISKCLADQLGYCIFAGTPKGKGHFYRVYKVAKENKNWTLVFRTIDESLKNESGQTIANLQQALEDDRELVKQGLMTEDELQQEWYNSFEAAIKGAVYLKELAEARGKKRFTKALYDRTLPVYTVWDLGVSKSDALAVGFFQRVGTQIRMIDYFETVAMGLPHSIKIVKQKPYVYGKHFAPHDITHKEVGTGKTRLSTASSLGIDFEVVPMLRIDDGIDLARAMFTRLFVDEETCELFLDLIGQYHYEFDEKRGQYGKVPVHDFTSHAADMLRYAAVIEDEMTNENPPDDPEPPDLDDDFRGTEDDGDDPLDGYAHHPALRGVHIGNMGHTKPPKSLHGENFIVSPYVPCTVEGYARHTIRRDHRAHNKRAEDPHGLKYHRCRRLASLRDSNVRKRHRTIYEIRNSSTRKGKPTRHGYFSNKFALPLKISAGSRD